MAFATALVALAALSAPSAPQQREQSALAIAAKEIWLADGQRVSDGVLLIEDGKIKAAGRGVDVESGTPLLQHDGVLTPGLIAFDTVLGLDGESSEPRRSVLTGGRVIDAFDKLDDGLALALRQGITTLVIAPSASTLAGGRCAVVKTSSGAAITSEGHLALSLCERALDADRFPTSSSGAQAELARLFSEGEGLFGEAAAGRLPVLMVVETRDDVRRALALAERHELSGVLCGARRAGDLAGPIAASGLSVVVGPIGAGSPQIELESAAALAAARVPLAFGLGAPARHPAGLRLSAALCMRAGLDPAAAWSALTASAATAAGVGERVGRLERGLDADFVLWSGDPLDLASRPVAVYVDGVRANLESGR
jgi:imidazolonepropionase-like amidohydrolase